jgi:3-hydroxy acid dehydrogenase / malonic semialdehyde reductase
MSSTGRVAPSVCSEGCGTPSRWHKLRRVAGLEGKTAIVTGASSGIGAAIAKALATAGARVAGGARRTDRLETEVALELDVTDPESCGRFVAAAVRELGGLDILVNNAGLGLGREPFDESTEEDEETVLETNVHGVLRMTRLCLPHLRDGGHIVNIGSVAGRQPYENAAVYIASKYAVRGFTYALREDLLGRPIHVNTVDPGLVETNFSAVRYRGDTEKAKAVYAGLEPVRPEDVAECVVFALTRPGHVNIDEIVIKALAQSSAVRVVRA